MYPFIRIIIFFCVFHQIQNIEALGVKSRFFRKWKNFPSVETFEENIMGDFEDEQKLEYKNSSAVYTVGIPLGIVKRELLENPLLKVASPTNIHIGKAEQYFLKRYQDLLIIDETSPLDLEIKKRCEELIVENTKEREKIHPDIKEKTVVCIGAGPVALLNCPNLIPLGFKIFIIEKRSKAPHRKQILRYEQDLDGESDISKLLGRGLWRMLQKEGYVIDAIQDPGDLEIFAQFGSNFHTIPIYVQEIVLRKMIFYFQKKFPNQIKMFTGTTVEDIQNREVLLNQNGRRGIIPDVSIIIGSAGSKGSLKHYTQDNATIPQTEESRGIVFSVPNCLAFANKDFLTPGENSLFSHYDNFTHGEAVNHSTTFYRNFVDSPFYKSALMQFIVSTSWNSATSRLYTRLAGFNLSQDIVVQNLENFMKDYMPKNMQSEFNIMPILQQLILRLDEAKKKLETFYDNEVRIGKLFNDRISDRGPVDQSLLEELKAFYPKDATIDKQRSLIINKKTLGNTLSSMSVNKLQDIMTDYVVVLLAMTKMLQNFFILYMDKINHEIAEQMSTNLKKALESFVTINQYSILNKKSKYIENMNQYLENFNNKKQEINLKNYEEYLNKHSDLSPKVRILKLEKLKQLELLFAKHIKSFSLHQIDIEEIINLEEIERDDFMTAYIRQHMALQNYLFISSIYAPLIDNLATSNELPTIPFDFIYSNTLRSRDRRQEYYHNKKPSSAQLFYLYFVARKDVLKTLKEKFHWEKDRLPIVRIFNNADEVYVGAEYPQKMSASSEDQKDYLKLILSLYFKENFILNLLEFPTNQNSSFFSKDQSVFPVSINAALKSSGDLGGSAWFLIGDESVNAHYLTGSGVIAGFQSAAKFCELLKDGKNLADIKKEYQKFQDKTTMVLLNKSRHLDLLNPMSKEKKAQILAEQQEQKKRAEQQEKEHKRDIYEFQNGKMENKEKNKVSSEKRARSNNVTLEDAKKLFVYMNLYSKPRIVPRNIFIVLQKYFDIGVQKNLVDIKYVGDIVIVGKKDFAISVSQEHSLKSA